MKPSSHCSYRFFRSLSLVLLLSLTLSDRESRADDLINNNSGGAWSDNSNWQDGSAPVSSTDKDIVITGAATASNQDIATPFILESLSLLGGNNHTLSGNQLQFQNLGSAPSLVVNPNSANRLLQIDADMDLANDLDISIFDGDLTLNNVISGANGLNLEFQTTNSSYIAVFDGSLDNTYTGATTIAGLSTFANIVHLAKDNNIVAIGGDLIVDRAWVRTFADNQIDSSAVATVKNNGYLELNHFQTLAGVDFDSGGTVFISNSEAFTLLGNVNASGGFSSFDNSSGSIDLGTGNRTFNVEPGTTLEVNPQLLNGDLTKSNDGLLNIRNSTAFTGNITLSGGTLRMAAGFTNNQNFVAPVGTTIELNNGSYSGVVSGAGNFGVAGGGTLNLSTAQTYTGDTNITSSALTLNNSELLPDGTDFTLSNGTLNVDSFDETVGTVTLQNGGSINGGSGSLSASAFDLQSGSVSAELTGTANVTKTTGNTVTLSGSSSYTGTTTIDGGRFDLNGAERLPDTTDVTINNFADLRLNDTETVDEVVITGGDIVNIGGTPKLIASSYVINGGSTNVELSGAGGLTKNGTSQFTISAPLTYLGNTTINQGTLRITSAGDLPATTVSIDGNGNLRQENGVTTTIDTLSLIDGFVSPGSGTGTATLSAATDFDVRKGSINAILAGAATLSKTTADTVTLNAANTYTGTTTISDGILQLSRPDAVPGNVANSGILRFQGSDGTFAGAVSGTGDVEVSGGNVTFSGLSTHSGKTIVINSRTIDISANERLSDNTDLEIGNSSFSSGTLDLTTFNDTVNSVTLFRGNINGTGTLNASAFDLQNGTVNATLAGGSFNKNTGNTVTINSASAFGAVTHEDGSLSGSGSISGSSYDVREGTTNVPLNGAGALTKTTTSTYNINSASGYSGATNVNDGTLRINSSGSLTATSAANINGGSLQLQGNEQLPNAAPVDILGGGSLTTQTETIGSLTLTDGSSGGAQLTATAANYDVRKGSISNSLAGTVGLVKTTADTVTLSGVNSYSGGTTISAGVLEGSGPAIQGNVVNNTVLRYVGSGGTSPADISGPGSVEVNAGITLTGTNSYTGGTTVNSSLNGDTDSIQGNIVNNGNVQFSNTANGTYAGDISGSGGLGIFGTAEVLLTGNNTYTNATSVLGQVALGSNSAFGPGNIQFANATIRAEGAARTLANNFDIVFGFVTFGGSEDLAFTQTDLLNVAATTTLASTNTAKTTINREINAAFGSTIHAAGGEFAIGNPNSFTGFKTLGDLVIDPGATLTLQSLGFIDLPGVTVMTNGTLGASNGFSLGASENILGAGTVAGDIAAQIGSIIAATTGDLTVGNGVSVSGYFSDGLLITNENTVTINDKNNAVLGALTKLGTATQTGTLVAGAAVTTDTFSHFLLEQGKDLTGRGNISGNFKNHGAVTGDGTGAGERIVFDAPWTVTGKGTFVNTTVLGTFSPGESPGMVDGENFLLGGDVIIELGGETPGSGPENHDQIIDDGLLALGSAAELVLTSWNQFLPEIGDEFVVMTWADGIDGSFAGITVDSWFAENGIGFELDYRDPDNAGSLIARAVETADFNLDGRVNGQDLAAWRKDYGSGLDGGNLLAWQRQFVGSPDHSVQAAAVPEPASWQLCGLLGVGLSNWFLRRRS